VACCCSCIISSGVEATPSKLWQKRKIPPPSSLDGRVGRRSPSAARNTLANCKLNARIARAVGLPSPKRLRIELYLDSGDKDQNKQRFEQLLARKNNMEQVVGEPMEWERMDNRQACRIAVYSKAQILTDAESPTLLEWAAKKATSFYKAFEPEFPPGRSPL
jgi:Domain of unknown function (DUF4268)